MAIEVYSGVYNGLAWTITNAMTVTTEREYIQDPQFSYVVSYDSAFGRANGLADEIYNPELIDEYTALYQSLSGATDSRIMPSVALQMSYNITAGTRTASGHTSVNIPTQLSFSERGNFISSLDTNIPIFLAEDIAYYNIYVNRNKSLEERNEALTHAFNYSSGETIPDGRDFEIRNMYAFGEWTEYGQPNVTQVYWRGLRGRITSGRLAYYNGVGIEDGALKVHIVSDATFYGLESYNGQEWLPVANNLLPFDFFYRKHTNELGEFYYGLTFENTTIPQFSDEETAQDYLDEIINESDADNWGEISQNYPDQITTGEPDTDPTTMGEIFTRAFFSQQYICGVGAIQEISNALFDITTGGVTGLWEDIKKGLEMYGDSPVDDIQGLMFFPFPLGNVITNTQNQNYIYFGGYRFDLQNSTVDKIIYSDNEIDFGSWFCPERFSGGFRDFAPYRRLYCYLPYIGWTELDIKRYIGKTVNVKYYIDTRTGGCLACLFANGILYDYFNGQMGVSMPITASDFVSYANAQIQTLLGGVGTMKDNGATVVNSGAKMVEGGVGVGATALGMLPVATAVGGVGVAKTLYGLTQNNINNFNVTKGASSSMLNCKLPQEIMFLDEVQDGKPTDNELSLMGYPSNTSGRLKDFSGYLEVDAVNLVCDTATENERAELITLLKTGVII